MVVLLRWFLLLLWLLLLLLLLLLHALQFLKELVGGFDLWLVRVWLFSGTLLIARALLIGTLQIRVLLIGVRALLLHGAKLLLLLLAAGLLTLRHCGLPHVGLRLLLRFRLVGRRWLFSDRRLLDVFFALRRRFGSDIGCRPLLRILAEWRRALSNRRRSLGTAGVLPRQNHTLHAPGVLGRTENDVIETCPVKQQGQNISCRSWADTRGDTLVVGATWNFDLSARLPADRRQDIAQGRVLRLNGELAVLKTYLWRTGWHLFRSQRNGRGLWRLLNRLFNCLWLSFLVHSFAHHGLLGGGRGASWARWRVGARRYRRGKRKTCRRCNHCELAEKAHQRDLVRFYTRSIAPCPSEFLSQDESIVQAALGLTLVAAMISYIKPVLSRSSGVGLVARLASVTMQTSILFVQSTVIEGAFL